jgi:hypothetical protein
LVQKVLRANLTVVWRGNLARRKSIRTQGALANGYSAVFLYVPLASRRSLAEKEKISLAVNRRSGVRLVEAVPVAFPLVDRKTNVDGSLAAKLNRIWEAPQICSYGMNW